MATKYHLAGHFQRLNCTNLHFRCAKREHRKTRHVACDGAALDGS